MLEVKGNKVILNVVEGKLEIELNVKKRTRKINLVNNLELIELALMPFCKINKKLKVKGLRKMNNMFLNSDNEIVAIKINTHLLEVGTVNETVFKTIISSNLKKTKIQLIVDTVTELNKTLSKESEAIKKKWRDEALSYMSPYDDDDDDSEEPKEEVA